MKLYGYGTRETFNLSNYWTGRATRLREGKYHGTDGVYLLQDQEQARRDLDLLGSYRVCSRYLRSQSLLKPFSPLV